jgi:hypothetical protein
MLESPNPSIRLKQLPPSSFRMPGGPRTCKHEGEKRGEEGINKSSTLLSRQERGAGGKEAAGGSVGRGALLHSFGLSVLLVVG